MVSKRQAAHEVVTAARWAEPQGPASFALPDHQPAVRSPTGNAHEEARDAFGPHASPGGAPHYLQILGGFGLDHAAEVLEVLGG